MGTHNLILIDEDQVQESLSLGFDHSDGTSGYRLSKHLDI